MKKKDKVMGDKITINNSVIGAVGRGAVNFGNVTSTSGNYDYKVILEEIKKLKEALYSMPQNDAQIIAISNVIEAENAASSEDAPTMIKHLKKLGLWVFDVARDIGVNVISGYIGSR
jgi:hypothetical protein